VESSCSALATQTGQMAGKEVLLADGSLQQLEGMSRDELLALQWLQERQFAAQILAAPKSSALRNQAIHQAYETVTGIITAKRALEQVPMVLGMHPRHVRLVLDLLRNQRRCGLPVPSLSTDKCTAPYGRS